MIILVHSQFHKNHIKINNLIILMKQKKTKKDKMVAFKEYNTERITKAAYKPTPLNTDLTENPFLLDQDKYKYISFKIKNYNKKIQDDIYIDEYEVICLEKLHLLLADLTLMQTKEDQIQKLQQTFTWLKDQQRLVQQRKAQGQVRYKPLLHQKHSRMSKKTVTSEITNKNELVIKNLEKEIHPYKKNHRTHHKQLEHPSIRLQQYKRKLINIAPFAEIKEEILQSPRIIYPKIQKMPDFKIEDDDDKIVQGKQNVQVLENIEKLQKNDKGQNKEGQGELKDIQSQPTLEGQSQQLQNPDQQQQDLGFGEEPQEEVQEEKEPEEGEDKLAPKRKNYTIQLDDIKRQQYKGAYQFYRGENSTIQHKLQKKYEKMQIDSIKKNRQQTELIQLLDKWGQSKSKVERDLQKKLQIKALNLKYSFSLQNNPEQQRLSPAEELKYGVAPISKTEKKKSSTSEINLSGFSLPKIGSQSLPQNHEKNIRKNRLSSLKSKYKKMLSIIDYEQRVVSDSMNQVSPRRRDLSEIIRSNSKEKIRQQQLEEVVMLKEKLSHSKIGVEMHSLSVGLISPADETDVTLDQFPAKPLLNNPYFVQAKKKKKKK